VTISHWHVETQGYVEIPEPTGKCISFNIEKWNTIGYDRFTGLKTKLTLRQSRDCGTNPKLVKHSTLTVLSTRGVRNVAKVRPGTHINFDRVPGYPLNIYKLILGS